MKKRTILDDMEEQSIIDLLELPDSFVRRIVKEWYLTREDEVFQSDNGLEVDEAIDEYNDDLINEFPEPINTGMVVDMVSNSIFEKFEDGDIEKGLSAITPIAEIETGVGLMQVQIKIESDTSKFIEKGSVIRALSDDYNFKATKKPFTKA